MSEQKLWARSAEAPIAGVCAGMAKRFGIDVVLIRLIWVCSFLIYGAGLALYIILAIGLPREDRIGQANEPRIWGVCLRFAKRFDLDIGLTRVGFLLALFSSFGMAFFLYLAFYFILPKNSQPNLPQS